MVYNRTRGERTPAHLAYSHLTKKVYLVKGNGAREDWTNHFMGFVDTVLPGISEAAKQEVADALGLTLPAVITLRNIENAVKNREEGAL